MKSSLVPFRFSLAALLLALTGCFAGEIRPILGLNPILAQSGNSFREPGLAMQWLVSLANDQGKERIEMIDLQRLRRVALPGINRIDAQPISVSVSADGQTVALIRQRADQTELLIYRRSSGALQRLELSPKGIPRRVSLDGTGRVLAVQVSRGGSWDVDIIRL